MNNNHHHGNTPTIPPDDERYGDLVCGDDPDALASWLLDDDAF